MTKENGIILLFKSLNRILGSSLFRYVMCVRACVHAFFDC